MYRWMDRESSPADPNQMVGTGNVGLPGGPWLPAGTGVSSGSVATPIVFELNARYRYFQLVETRSPNGFELPLVQWRIILEYDVDVNLPVNQNLNWEELADNWWIRVEEVGDSIRSPAFIRQPANSPTAGAGEWYIGNHAQAILPFTGGSSNLLILILSLSAVMLSFGLYWLRELGYFTRGRMMAVGDGVGEIAGISGFSGAESKPSFDSCNSCVHGIKLAEEKTFCKYRGEVDVRYACRRYRR